MVIADGLGVIPPGVGLDIQLVMSDRTLFDGDNEPAFLTGYGPIPAALARRLVREASPSIKSWIRRLYTDPGDRAVDRRRFQTPVFSLAARQFLIARDQTCRGPFCDAPIRHADHVVPHEQGGPTRTAMVRVCVSGATTRRSSPGWQSVVDEARDHDHHPDRAHRAECPATTAAVHTLGRGSAHRVLAHQARADRPLSAKSPVERRLPRLIRSAEAAICELKVGSSNEAPSSLEESASDLQ